MGEDSDYVLALQLQQQFDKEEDTDQEETSGEKSYQWNKSPTKHVKQPEYDNLDTSAMSLVDPRWELIDPVPEVRALFLEFNDKYFWGRLAGIEVKWSPRMTLCAGLCVYEGRGGLCSVRLSGPLLKLRPRKDLIETLLHEMIHAYLFVTDNNKDHDGHGPEFHKHMYRLNSAAGTNISVYHTFHDEVENYRQHWWRCNGPCQTKPPYFGYVKRSMNRAPSPRDPWWMIHQQSCGGTYTKVKEPEGYGTKKKVHKEEKKLVKPKGNTDIRLFGSNENGTKGEKKSATSAATKASEMDKAEHPVIVNGVLRPVNGATSTSSIHDTVQIESKKVDLFRPTEGQANIHGFKEFHSSKKSKVSPVQNGAFSGVGKTLDDKNRGSIVGPIIRRIPGIGTIPSERYLLDSKKDILSELDVSKAAEDASLPKDSSPSTNKSGSVVDYNSDDSEFDEFLDALLKPVFKKTKKKKKTDSKSGFISVCKKNGAVSTNAHRKGVSDQNESNTALGINRKQMSSPGVTDKKRCNIKTKQTAAPSVTSGHHTSSDSVTARSQANCGKVNSSEDVKVFRNQTVMKQSSDIHKPIVSMHGGCASRTGSGHMPKRKFPSDFAMDRNKRALDLVSSDSESDIDENVTIGSVIRQKVGSPANHVMKRLKISDEPLPDVENRCQSLDSSASLSQVLPPYSNGAIHPEPPSQDVASTDFVSCPVCQAKMKQMYINEHLDTCLS